MANTLRVQTAKTPYQDAPAVTVDWFELLADRDAGSVSDAAQGAQVASREPGIAAATLTSGALTYTQNFNTLPTSGTTNMGTALEGGFQAGSTGWVFLKSNQTTNSTYIANAGGTNNGTIYSFGTGTDADRALGSVGSGTPGTQYYGVSFTNNTGATITSLDISYVGEQWRIGGNRTVADRLDFQINYAATTISAATGWVDVDALDFISPQATGAIAAIDGNAVANRTAKSTTISGLTIAAGATFYIRFADADSPGSDDGLAVDDFTLTANIGAPTPQPGSFSIAPASAAEAAGVLTFTVSRTGGAAGAATLDYAVTPSGTNPVDANDFVGGTLPAAGTVTFADGETSRTITIATANDAVYEADETFTVTLSNATAGTIGTAAATGTIANDDAAPVLTIGDVTLAEGNSGSTAFTFTVTLGGATTQTATVGYSIANGTTDANDFAGGTLPAGGTLTFAPGTTTQTVTVNIAGDLTVEDIETFTVNLSNAVGATIGDAQATGTIVNDETAPANGQLSIGNATLAEGTGADTAFSFVVTRSGGSLGAVSATYTLANGTTDASDFGSGEVPTGTVSFADGETSKTISVRIAGDALYEANETFTVTLSDATGGATLGTTTGTGTVTNDDAAPTLSIGDATVTEGNAGTTLLTYTVTASAVSGAPITFDVATAGGTATVGTDYVAQTITGATIPAGQTSYTFSVVVNGDLTAETDETVLVNLSNVAGATVADGQGAGTIVNDDGTPTTALIFSESFTGFTAAGFAPTPDVGQLDSDVWRVAGLSDIRNPAYGFTGVTSDFAGGIAGTNPTGAAVYSRSAADGALMVQPTGAEFDVNGFIEARIANTSGSTASSFAIAFDWAYRNNEPRSDNLQLSYSTDGTTFTIAPAGAFSTPGTADALGFQIAHRDVDISNVFVGAGGFLYLRWTHTGSSGSGSRDEVGIDNVVVNAGLTNAAVASVDSIGVVEGNGPGTTDAVFTITRSGGTGTASVAYTTVDGTAVGGSDYVAQSGTVTFAEGQTTVTVSVAILGDTANESNETFFLDLSNGVNVALPAPRGTATIGNDDAGTIAIFDIQGRGIVSPLVGQTVATGGVVTAVDTNGFYLQDPSGDGDIGTSDAVFVFTGTAPTVAVGNLITLSATVTEFTSTTAGSASLTELTAPTAIAVVTQSVPLPAAVLIATDGTGRAPPTSVIDDDGLTSYDPTGDGFDFYESLEGMRVTIQTPRVVANTNGFGETYVVASNGVGATGLNSRSGMTISAGDNNPETIVITRDAGVNAGYVANHSQGDTLGNVTGVLDYRFAQYELVVTAPVTTTNDVTLARETTALKGDATHLSYATFNVENLAPVPDSTVADRNTQAKVDLAFARHATEVVNALKNPDIIGLQEVQDVDGIGAGTNYSGQATADKLIAAIVLAGGPAYKYIEIAPTANQTTGGEPNGNIRNGYLYNPERVSYVEGSARLLTDQAYNNTRKPLLADFLFNGQVFTAADLHSTSRGGSDPLFGGTQPPGQAGDAARTAQATALATYINGVLSGEPGHKFIVNGDFNGYYYENALKALESTNGGTGPLNNLSDLLPVAERYSYYFGGYYQFFDNILVSGGLYGGAQVDVVHYNAGFTDGLSATDHDQTVAVIDFTRTGAAAAVAVGDAATTSEALQLRGTVLSNDTGGAGTAVVALNGAATLGVPVRLASGALVTLNADGSYIYNGDGAFAALATGGVATDTFRYTLTGGSTATVTVTINGVTDAPGTTGNDVAAGTAGVDTFDYSQGGVDFVAGGAGNDSAFFGTAFTAQDRFDGGSGNDQLGLQGDYTGANRLVLGASTVTNVETIALLGAFGYDLTTAQETVAAGQALSIYGSALPAGSTLTFDGSAETDGGRFVVYGGLGTDLVTGGSGDDAIYFGRGGRFGANDVVNGGAGTDQLAFQGSFTGTIDAAHVRNVEQIVLLEDTTPTTDYTITLADDWALPGDLRAISFNTLRTGATIDGSAETSANLLFFGGAGNDTITGGGGNDTLYGAGGSDRLTGGAGADTYAYTQPGHSIGSAFDTIVGFDASIDRIDLPTGVSVTAIDPNASGAADRATLDDALTALLGNLGANHAVQFTVTGGDLASSVFEVIDANGVAGYQAGEDMVILLETGTPIVDPAVFI